MPFNYYEILGITIDATDEQIKRAYRLNAIKYHPDKHFGDPVFTQKFIAIKEAYEILIDPDKRMAFNLQFKTDPVSSATSQQSQYNRQYQEEKEEEKFRYDPHKPFYSRYDREQNETPQHQPIRTPWGDDLAEYLVFFSFPEQIGKLIGGFSSLVKGVKKKSFGRLLLFAITDSYIILPIVALLLLLLWNNWHNNLHQEGTTKRALIIFGVISLIVIGFKTMMYSNAITFRHLNYFIGINGFALYHCEGTIDNVVYSKEVQFREVTDLVTSYVVRKRSFQYEGTDFHFIWMNVKNGSIIYEQKGSHGSEDDNPPKHILHDYWMNKEAEKYWTVYLLDNMDNMLQEKGFIEFNLYSIEQNVFSSYIRLGVGYITIIKNRTEFFTYKFNEIKKIYTKKGELYIEHKNFEKKLFGFKSGNQDSIPLAMLCNRQFFYKAMEILLGYSI